MQVYQVKFLPSNKSITVDEDTTILNAEIAAGLDPDAPCGGQGKCGKCKVNIIQGYITGTHKACDTKIKSDMVIETNVSHEHAILTTGASRDVVLNPIEDFSHIAEPVSLIAFDIGTTTVVGYLMDGHTGEELAVASMLNPQVQYGADVIMRSNHALEVSRSDLSSCIRKALNDLITELCEKTVRLRESVRLVSIVGNTCMHHLFLELPTDSLVRAPYEPAKRDPMLLKAADYDINVHPDGQLMMLPCIAGFVGADTVGCLLATDFLHREPLSLMIDIGTNGEMVLGNRDHMITCSTAAGPALEGAKISCGMRGTEGAIDHVYLNEDGSITWSVIGGGAPQGICGSGLLDAINVFLKAGIVDPSGRMKGDKYTFAGDVALLQKDVRELQLAKGAIAAGIESLCQQIHVKEEDVKEILIAGAFGNYMDPDSACGIGMLPEIFTGRIKPVGNAAGVGSKMAILNKKYWNEAKTLMEDVEFLELAILPDFQDTFVDHLAFPGDEED